MKALLRFVGLYLAASLIVGAFSLLDLWPWHPQTSVGWLVLSASALPLTVVGQRLWEVVLENRFAASLGSNTAPNSVSWSRVAYGLVAVLSVFVVVFAVWLALAALLKSVPSLF
jgi:hypothetical protein